MKSLMIATITALFFTVCSPLHAVDATRLQAAKKLLKVMNMKQQYGQMIDITLKSQLARSPQMAPYKDIMMKFFRKYMSWNEIKKDITRLYAKEFSATELNDLVKFYSTPTGRKAAKKMAVLFQKGAELGRQKVQSHMPELIKMIQARQAQLNKKRLNK